MSTRCESERRAPALRLRAAGPGRLGLLDPAESVALVARAKREPLLRAHRHRLPHEDLEDCYSQATLELIARARRGEGFAGDEHIANALDQRLLSRIHDRRRAIEGRSPIEAALARALPLGVAENGEIEPADERVSVEELVALRHDLRRIHRVAWRLTRDQRLVLHGQVVLQLDCGEFCERHGWSAEKFRKVSQRARARLRDLLACEPAARGTAGWPDAPAVRERAVSRSPAQVG